MKIVKDYAKTGNWNRVLCVQLWHDASLQSLLRSSLLVNLWPSPFCFFLDVLHPGFPGIEENLKRLILMVLMGEKNKKEKLLHRLQTEHCILMTSGSHCDMTILQSNNLQAKPWQQILNKCFERAFRTFLMTGTKHLLTLVPRLCHWYTAALVVLASCLIQMAWKGALSRHLRGVCVDGRSDEAYWSVFFFFPSSVYFVLLSGSHFFLNVWFFRLFLCLLCLIYLLFFCLFVGYFTWDLARSHAVATCWIQPESFAK